MKKSAEKTVMSGLTALTLVVLFIASGCSPSQPDPMDPYRELGVPQGFTKDTYKAKTEKKKKKEKSGFSFFRNKDEEERRKKIRDVSRPLEPGTMQVFPWDFNGGSSRSSKLYEELRQESGRKEQLYW